MMHGKSENMALIVGGSGDRDNAIVLRPFDERQSSSDASRWKKL
jgi:hypothetical protein